MRSIYPVLRYTDPRAAIDWLGVAFGFHVHAVHEAPDGTVAHAELIFDHGMVMIGRRPDAAPPRAVTAARTGGRSRSARRPERAALRRSDPSAA